MSFKINELYTQLSAHGVDPNQVLDFAPAEKNQSSGEKKLTLRKISQQPLDKSATTKAAEVRKTFLDALCQTVGTKTDSALGVQLKKLLNGADGVDENKELTALTARKIIDYARAYSEKLGAAITNSLHTQFPERVQKFLLKTIQGNRGNAAFCELMAKAMAKDPPKFELKDLFTLCSIASSGVNENSPWEDRLAAAYLCGFGGKPGDKQALTSADATDNNRLLPESAAEIDEQIAKGREHSRHEQLASVVVTYVTDKPGLNGTAQLLLGQSEENNPTVDECRKAFAKGVQDDLMRMLGERVHEKELDKEKISAEIASYLAQNGNATSVQRKGAKAMLIHRTQQLFKGENPDLTGIDDKPDQTCIRRALKKLGGELDLLLEKDRDFIKDGYTLQTLDAQAKALFKTAYDRIARIRNGEIPDEKVALHRPMEPASSHGPLKAEEVTEGVVWKQGKNKCYMMSVFNALAAKNTGRAHLKQLLSESGKIKLVLPNGTVQETVFEDARGDVATDGFSQLETTLFEVYRKYDEKADIKESGFAESIAKMLGLGQTESGLSLSKASDADSFEDAFEYVKSALLDKNKICLLQTEGTEGSHYRAVVGVKIENDKVKVLLRDSSANDENMEKFFDFEELAKNTKVSLMTFDIPQPVVNPPEVQPNPQSV